MIWLEMITFLNLLKMAKVQSFNCLTCNSSFSSKQILRRHEDSIHKGIKFDCQDCGKQYTQKCDLTRHVNSVHKGIKFKCNQCEKKFTYASVRNTHVKSVHEQKKYRCSVCDYQATEHGNLKQHKNQFIKVSSIYVQFVYTKQQQKVVLLHILRHNIKETNISVILVIRNIKMHHVSEDTLNQHMKV